MSPTGSSPRGTAVITGATAGIGLSFAHQLAARGHDLVLVARDTVRLDAVAAEIATTYGVPVEVLTADLADREQLATVADRLGDPARPVELLVNNAGFGLKNSFLVNDVEAEQAMLDVMVTAVLRLTHAALGGSGGGTGGTGSSGGMVERGRGGVINVSSVAAFLPRGTYAATKAWVNSFSAWAANEYRPAGVRVMALCPGFTTTEFHERMQVMRGTGFLWLDPDFLVERALADFDRGRSRSIPGGQYKLIVGLTRLIPARALQSYQSIGRR